MKFSLLLTGALLLSSTLLNAGVAVDLGTVKIGDKVTINDKESDNKKSKNKGNNGKSEYAPGHQGKNNKKSNSEEGGVSIKIGK